jgi:hypothetical protein
MSTVLLTHASAENDAMADLTEPGKMAYCKKWGLDYLRVETCDFSCWLRPMIWRQQLQNCDRIFFMGTDTVITNSEIPPLDYPHDLVIAADGNGINNDVFFMRSNERTLKFCLDVMRNKTAEHEQYAMSEVMSGSHYGVFAFRLGVELKLGGYPAPRNMNKILESVYQHGPTVKIVPQRDLNAYPHELYGLTGYEDQGWHEGDFVAHCPGVCIEDKMAQIRKILPLCK